MSFVRNYYLELPVGIETSNVLILGALDHFTKEAVSHFTKARIYSIDHRLNLQNVAKQEDVVFLNYFFDEKKVLPFRKNTFDVVIIPHYIRDVLYRESLVKSLSDIIKDQGHILIVESSIESTGDNVAINIDEILEYLDRSSFELLKKIDTNNFEYGIIAKRYNDIS
jgi:ubiquinone/menaquinone biosynthesis C-methylase UbiE